MNCTGNSNVNSPTGIHMFRIRVQFSSKLQSECHDNTYQPRVGDNLSDRHLDCTAKHRDHAIVSQTRRRLQHSSCHQTITSCTHCLMDSFFSLVHQLSFSALTLLAGHQEQHLACDEVLVSLCLQCFNAIGRTARRATSL